MLFVPKFPKSFVRPLLLELFPQFCVVPPDVGEFRPAEEQGRSEDACNRKVDEPQVHAHILRRLLLRFYADGERQVNVPLSAAFDELRRPLFGLTGEKKFQILNLVLLYLNGHAHPFLQGGKGDFPGGSAVLQGLFLYPEVLVVEVRPEPLERFGIFLGLDVPDSLAQDSGWQGF
ncbi:hypothetical protein CEB3_c05050 [Peptococcaceae bacterium CEB3]|nr:hypothetical protein CEB3_c05050 [Peptococcaceae bacterium CEB3]